MDEVTVARELPETSDYAENSTPFREALHRVAEHKKGVDAKKRPKQGTFDAGEEVGRIWTRALSNGDELRGTVYLWGEMKWLDIRRWDLVLGTGEHRASRKGVRMLPDHFEELVSAYAVVLDENPDMLKPEKNGAA